ncbi:hypothetical protein BD408DRAFT_409374 [Parasitella parasitica]|nr:hypothetical protein BD408DRAFT_409374 [Parasitella parasitica]
MSQYSQRTRMTPSAYGYIRDKSSQEFGSPMRRNLLSNVTVLIEVTKVVKPNMRLPEHGPKKTLADTGCSRPFVVVNKSMLRKCSENHDSSNVEEVVDHRIRSVDNAGDLQHYEEQLLNNDIASHPLHTNDTVVRKSRILKDVFHLIDMLKVPIKHSLCAGFKRKYRDILLVPDPVDKANVTRVLLSANTTWEYKIAVESFLGLETGQALHPTARTTDSSSQKAF